MNAFPSWAITVDIHATLLPLNLICAFVFPVKLRWIENDRKHCGRNFCFRQADVKPGYSKQLWSQYSAEERKLNACQNFKGRSSCMGVQVLGVCYSSLCTGAPQAYQQGVFSIFSILWVRRLPVPTPSFHYSGLCMCIGGESDKKKKKQHGKRKERRHSQIGYFLQSGLMSTKGNGINISNVHSGSSLEKDEFKANNSNPLGPSASKSVNALSLHLP